MRAVGGVLVALVVACGRVGFDPAGAGNSDAPGAGGDAGPLDVGPGCIVGLEMNEQDWSLAFVADSCGGDHPATPVGQAEPVDDPVRGRVGQFGGQNDCLEVVDASELDVGGALTMSIWAYPTGLDGTSVNGLFSRRVDNQIEVFYTMFVWTGDRVAVDIDSENDEMFGDVAIENGRWQMITAVYDGAQPAAGRVRVYVDGLLDRVLPESSASIPPSTLSLFVGCLPQIPPAPYQSFAGRLDDAFLWSRAFTANEVQAWYEATRR